MKEYNSTYIGIVVQNNDPDQRGRVKVFVPHISGTVYNKWIEDKTDKKYKFIGFNIDSDLTPILEDLKLILPWCEICSPLTSENSSGRFNNFNYHANTSDGNFYSNFAASSGSKPGSVYENANARLEDAFTGDINNVNNPNPYSYMYKPTTYTNAAKGVFGVPAVGSHVYVFFRDGNPNFPVVTGASYGSDDWNGIYNEPQDYPGKFENYPEPLTEVDQNVENYRNKYVLNQKGGTFEIVNSDLNEKIKLTHYSGSFKEFNNNVNIELATKNDQKLVLNDSFDTVQGFKNSYIGKDFDEIIKRDKYKKVGTLNTEYFDKWKEIVAVIQNNKQLFEIKRTNNNNILNSNGAIMVKRNSTEQSRAGKFINFPVTDGKYEYKALKNEDIQPGNGFGKFSTSTFDGPTGMNDLKTVAQPTTTAPIVSRWVNESGRDWLNGKGKHLSTQNGEWDVETKKDKLQSLIEDNLENLIKIENELGLGGSEVIEITKHKLETIGVLMNDFGSIRLDDIGKSVNNEVLVDDDGVYVNQSDSPLLEYVHVQDLPGGNSTLNVCNRYNVLVGAGGLHLKTYGPVNMSGTITNIAGEQINLGSDNEINIDAKTINISAEILNMRNKRQRQIIIENSLGVNKNLVVGGGLHVEGETFLQHVTAPREFQLTEQTTVFAKLLTGLKFKVNINGGTHVDAADSSDNHNSWTGGTITLIADSNDDKVRCYEHSHAFANLPLTLVDNNTRLREIAKEVNSGSDRSISRPQHNEKKSNFGPGKGNYQDNDKPTKGDT